MKKSGLFTAPLITANWYLKMAASTRTSGVDFPSPMENYVQITFVDEDDLPLASMNVLQHPESEEESESEEDEDSVAEEGPLTANLTRREDIDFDEPVGMSTNVNIGSLKCRVRISLNCTLLIRYGNC